MEKRYQALSRFTVLIATESWAGPGNEATRLLQTIESKSILSHSGQLSSSQQENDLSVALYVSVVFICMQENCTTFWQWCVYLHGVSSLVIRPCKWEGK